MHMLLGDEEMKKLQRTPNFGRAVPPSYDDVRGMVIVKDDAAELEANFVGSPYRWRVGNRRYAATETTVLVQCKSPEMEYW